MPAEYFHWRRHHPEGLAECSGNPALPPPLEEGRHQEVSMNKDRIQGSAEQGKGKVKEVAGKALGDSKLESEGKGDQVKGKVQNTIGGIKDTLRGK